MKNIVIIGAGDLGKEIVWLIEDINKVKPTYLILGFLDDTFINIGRKIGDRATVAAGSIVFTNVKPKTTVLGNPARRMKGIED